MQGWKVSRSLSSVLVFFTGFVGNAAADPPRIVSFGPEVKYVAVHGTYSFHVTARGRHRAYQWYHQEPDASQGHPIPVQEGFGSDRRRLKVTDTQATRDYNGWYWCVVTDTSTGETAESPRGQVFVVLPPTVTQPPHNQTIAAGETVTFSIEADSHAPVATKYRWYFNGRPMVHATQPTLTISSATARRAGTYSCRVRTLGGITMSPEALLTVQ
jgi:hypothetical protein